ncbi:WYL domain-containing protein [Wenzhouxiangella sp. XN79A]|uniref:helix-turn-helix transcriptional regulator n=1 Tax=Wenzhouxiangella sp. XN79A TaxID=2724193 RepID=UPI00144AC00C|nr:WYL domain-containing protein [Wenzhouxiangella sp. XN79A]NKI35104.1 WYL domain-containing protein [Wenzhouxiangella sp. XN79A]
MRTKRSERIAWLLYHLPRAPKTGLTVNELADRLERSGSSVAPNSLYRDLQDIQSALGPGIVECEDPGNGRAHRWRLTDASDLSLPGQSLQIAVALKVLERDGSHLIPPGVLDELAPLFGKADRVLDILKRSDPLAGWPERVRLNRPWVRRAIERHPPSIDAEVRRTVNRAVARQQCLALEYRSRSADSRIELVVHPIGIDSAMTQETLVGTVEHPDPALPEKYTRPYVQLVLHRIERARLLDRPIDADVSRRSMREYFDTGEHNLPRGGGRLTEGRTIRLKADLSDWAFRELDESPLSDDQMLTTLPDGRHALEATVSQSDNLKWWCLSMLPDLVVTGPSDFRQEIADAVRQSHIAYQQGR